MPPMALAENLRRLRSDVGMTQVDLAKASGVSQQLISQIERGVNLTTKELPDIAAALGVPLTELDPRLADVLGNGEAIDVPLLSWISAGAMMREDVSDEALGTIKVSDLPAGDWIALKVVGDSMDRISPPESTILVNRKDRRLVPNAAYVIADEDGNATYKRFRPSPMRFEPVSTNKDLEPLFPANEPLIVGRVRRTILEM